MRSRQPKDCEPPVFGPSYSVRTGYFGYLAVTGYLGSTAVARLVDIVFVGTRSVGRRPGREPVGRQLQ